MIEYKLEVKYFQNTYSQKYNNESDVRRALYPLFAANRFMSCNTADIFLDAIKNFNTNSSDHYYIKLDNVGLTIERINDNEYTIDALLEKLEEV